MCLGYNNICRVVGIVHTHREGDGVERHKEKQNDSGFLALENVFLLQSTAACGVQHPSANRLCGELHALRALRLALPLQEECEEKIHAPTGRYTLNKLKDIDGNGAALGYTHIY